MKRRLVWWCGSGVPPKPHFSWHGQSCPCLMYGQDCPCLMHGRGRPCHEECGLGVSPKRGVARTVVSVPDARARTPVPRGMWLGHLAQAREAARADRQVRSRAAEAV
ncbi:MAG: hypothetical protein NZ556_09625 [Fimbriimonadales bacterium]|nr:hypothetical protein [Fimbriimonadales bacterium]